MFASLIWGSAFVAQSVGSNHVGPFTFQALRTLIGGIVLIPTFLIADRIRMKQGSYRPMTKKEKQSALIGGALCGVLLCVATNLQQMGIEGTTVGKAGFITALYIIIVPLLGFFFRKRIKPHLFFCVILALAGLYLLCINEGFTLSKYDALILACALVFSFHILAIDKYAPLTDCIRMSCVQMFVSGLISLVLMFIFEKPDLSQILDAWFPIFYTGAFSSGIAYTLQIVGQKNTSPTYASMIMSLESVFSLLTGMVVLTQIPTLREGAGCAVMFAAIIIAQLLDEYSPRQLWQMAKHKLTGRKEG